MPRHNGKAERYQRIMTEELRYAREDERPHSAAGGQPSASRLRTRVTNVRPSYT
jgi:hypothetical protein